MKHIFQFIFSIEFWNDIKLFVDIIQSLAITAATIIGGIWAVKTFGYEERLRQLERLNRAVLNLREAFSAFYGWCSVQHLMDSDFLTKSNPGLTNLIIGAQVELRDALSSSMRIDFFKKMKWELDLITYTQTVPSFIDEELYRQMCANLNKISGEIVGEGRFGLPKWLRVLMAKF